MKAARQIQTPEITHAPDMRRTVFGVTPEILTEIYQDDIHMAVWKRETAARLITTYVGMGTQWLPHHCADRSKLGGGEDSTTPRLKHAYQ